MRILIKGGVWKNTEDEILKAAVMKYGKNQWARVASLLNRKSAKQCKARWYEWLDPSIKKTEWNKQEEEKLLHLAKLMPNQWRTIAPIVGRTAGQCMEHYEKLLDMAQEDNAGAGVGGTDDDPRRLRPGEIDPAPENKPARPDPIDMDEDEKEMLSEARARLANTQGKKAKRKARERQMEESRRLASLQKRRELKAAGVSSKIGGPKKRKFIDYATEIPFQKAVPSGFYDVQDETMQSKSMKLDPKKDGLEISKMEGRHKKEEEAREAAKDKKYMKKLFQDNAPDAILKVSEHADPVSLRRRLPLSLPSPQVDDAQLEDIVKLSQRQALMLPPQGGLSVGTRSSASELLLGGYAASDLASVAASAVPQRTPQQEDVLMQEARNLRALREMTPMRTAEDPNSQLPQLYEGTGFEGMAPRRHDVTTPNIFLGAIAGRGASSAGNGDSVVGLTPLVGSDTHSLISSSQRSVVGGGSSRPSAAPYRPPLRDQFGLNAANAATPSTAFGGDSDLYSEHGVGDDVSILSSRFGDSSVVSRAQHRRELGALLGALPEPEFTYEVALPELPAGDADEEEADAAARRAVGGSSARGVEDAADVLERQWEQRAHEARLAQQKRSSVVRKGLQCSTTPAAFRAAALADPTSNFSPAQQLTRAEMVQLVLHDSFRYGEHTDLATLPSTEGDYPLEDFSVETIAAARQLVLDESAEFFRSAPGAAYVAGFAAQWDEMFKSMLFVPSVSGDGAGSFEVPADKAALLRALALQFNTLKEKRDKDAKRAAKMETKVNVLSQGYVARGATLAAQLVAAQDAVDDMRRQVECEAAQREAEERFALGVRVAALRKEVAEAEQQEAQAQLQYASIIKFAKTIQ